MSSTDLNQDLSVSDVLYFCDLNRFEKKRGMMFLDEYSEALQQSSIEKKLDINQAKSFVTSSIFNRQISNYQLLDTHRTLASDTEIEHKNEVKHRKNMTKINTSVNKGGGKCKHQSGSNSKTSNIFRLRQQTVTRKGGNNSENANKGQLTSPVILRYQHKSRDSSTYPLFQRYNSMKSFQENSFDSVDLVFQANQPENLKLPSLNSLSLDVKQRSLQSQKTSKNNDMKNRRLFREHSWIEWDISNKTGRLNSIIEQGCDVMPCIRKNSNSSGESLDSKLSSPSQTFNFGNRDHDIFKNAYIKALKLARVRHFKHVPFEFIVTKPFIFSYFDLLRKNNRRKPYIAKSFAEMESIFGTIKIDDFVEK